MIEIGRDRSGLTRGGVGGVEIGCSGEPLKSSDPHSNDI